MSGLWFCVLLFWWQLFLWPAFLKLPFLPQFFLWPLFALLVWLRWLGFLASRPWQHLLAVSLSAIHKVIQKQRDEPFAVIHLPEHCEPHYQPRSSNHGEAGLT